jgi:hypothetical protein
MEAKSALRVESAAKSGRAVAQHRTFAGSTKELSVRQREQALRKFVEGIVGMA